MIKRLFLAFLIGALIGFVTWEPDINTNPATSPITFMPGFLIRLWSYLLTRGMLMGLKYDTLFYASLVMAFVFGLGFVLVTALFFLLRARGKVNAQ